jgi:integrase
MAVKVRPYVVATYHVDGCAKRRCGPGCKRATDGWEYHIRIELPNGEGFEERKKSPLSSKTATLRYAEERVRQAIRNSTAPKLVEVAVVPEVREFWSKFLTYSKTNNKPATVYLKEWVFRPHLEPFFGSMKLDAIGPADVEEFKAAKVAEGQSRKSINNLLGTLRKLLNLALEWDVITKVPKVQGFKVKNSFITDDMFLTFDEVDRFLLAAAPEWKVYTKTGVKTGLRVGELLALKWEDLDLVAGRLIVRRTLWRTQEGPPKGGKNREVPLSPDALAALRAHRHLRGPYVFCDEAGKRLTHSMVKDVVPGTCRRAGLAKRITNHGMRHTFASHLVMRGVPLKAVQELLGHESIEMTSATPT